MAMFISSYVLHIDKCKSINTEHPNIFSENNAKVLAVLGVTWVTKSRSDVTLVASQSKRSNGECPWACNNNDCVSVSRI
jgi:hypothetical protein